MLKSVIQLLATNVNSALKRFHRKRQLEGNRITCFYGTSEDGTPQVYHWGCLALHALLICKGHPLQAAEKFNLDPDEMTSMKLFYRAIPWGRLGFKSEDGH